MSTQQRQTKLLLVIIIVGIAVLIGYHLTRQREKVHPPLMIEEGLHRLGDIIVDATKGEIQFRAQVKKREGWVQHLIYLDGYKWLREESAIVSCTKLSDLQKALALLDWKVWDELWYGKTEDRRQKTEVRKLLLFVKWDEKEIAAQELVLAEDKLGIREFVFLGSPYFDYMALEAHHAKDCKLCPRFPLKQKALKGMFVRGSGQSGYELNSRKMPHQGTEVAIIIRLSK